jgi:hypothetical protein
VLTIRRWRIPWLLLILLLATGMRVLHLDFLDLNDDEAFFVQIAHQGTYLQLAGSSEPHPPLYLALLQGWMLAAGVTEYAVRYLSVMLGVLTVAAAYQFGARLAGEKIGLAASLVTALNPYQILYSQTTRDYQIACLFGLISFVVFLAALRRPRLWPAYAVSALLAIYSHYYAIAIVLLEQVILLAWLWRRHFRGWRPWLAADASIAAAYLPWSVYALPTVASYEPGHGSATILGSTLGSTWQLYNFGANVRPAEAFWLSTGAAMLLLLGAIGLFRAARWRALAAAAAYQAAPFIFGLATLLHTKQFGARFLFLGSPGYLLLGAGALYLFASWRWLAAAAPAAFLGGLTGYAIHNTVFTEEFVSGRYSRLAAYLARHIEPRQAVVLDGVSQTLQYWYYAQLRQGIANRVEIMPKDASGSGADGTPVDIAQTERALNQVLDVSQAAWLIDDDSLRYDPNLDTQRLLAAAGYEASSISFEGPRLDLYALGDPGPVRDKAAELGTVELTQATRANRPVPAGGAVLVTLAWQALRHDPPPFKVSLRLADASGAVVAQGDRLAGGGLWPAGWQTGTPREEKRGLLVPVGLLPGAYQLQLVAYDAASGQPLGPAVDLGPVQVDHSQPQRASAADVPPATATIGGERLVGARIDGQVAAGERLHLSLLWSGGPTSEPVSTLLGLGSTRVPHQLGGDAYPTTAWQAGDVVREDVALRVPPDLPPGGYPLMVGSAMLGNVTVLPTRRQFSPPPISQPLSASFGDVAQLLGYDLEPAASAVHLQLVWKALNPTSTSYTVFVHALDDQGRIVSQVDSPPGTDDWLPGQVITTRYDVAATGPYRIELGLYDGRTGKRLPVCLGLSSGCASPADHLDLPAGSS